MMRPKEFWGKVATWGSAMHASDPGSCLYGFDEKGLVQDEGHRADCISFLENECRKAALFNQDPAADAAEIDELVAYLKAAPVEGSAPELDEFTEAYVEAMLFSTTDEHDPETGGDPMSDNYSVEHLSAEAVAMIKAECARFQELYGEHLVAENFTGRGDSSPLAAAGHDFFLTREGHGAGYWDGDWAAPYDDFLTEASKSFGANEAYVGDDGRIHVSGGRPDVGPVEAPAAPSPAP